MPEENQLPFVLVVEDEPEVAAVVAEILRSRYRVEVVPDEAGINRVVIVRRAR